MINYQLISALQLGHTFSRFSHSFKHSQWKKCLQSILTQFCPSSNSSLHIVHLNNLMSTLPAAAVSFRIRISLILQICEMKFPLTLCPSSPRVIAIAESMIGDLIAHVINVDVVSLFVFVDHGAEFFA